MIEPVVFWEHEEQIIDQAKDCLKREESGDDFTALAKTFSQEPAAKQTGEKQGLPGYNYNFPNLRFFVYFIKFQ